jgi:hypothetical protein
LLTMSAKAGKRTFCIIPWNPATRDNPGTVRGAAFIRPGDRISGMEGKKVGKPVPAPGPDETPGLAPPFEQPITLKVAHSEVTPDGRKIEYNLELSAKSVRDLGASASQVHKRLTTVISYMSKEIAKPFREDLDRMRAEHKASKTER